MFLSYVSVSDLIIPGVYKRVIVDKNSIVLKLGFFHDRLVPLIQGTVPDFVTFQIFLWAFFQDEKQTCILSIEFYIKTCINTWSL